jgi:hypothetical protein
MFKGIKRIPGMVGVGMTPQFVAEQITAILYSGKAQSVILSKWPLPPSIIRILPQWMRVHIQDKSASALSDLNPHNPMAARL